MFVFFTSLDLCCICFVCLFDFIVVQSLFQEDENGSICFVYLQVAWYRLFARSASGNNVKVRLNDYQLPGTGEEVFYTLSIVCVYVIRLVIYSIINSTTGKYCSVAFI